MPNFCRAILLGLTLCAHVQAVMTIIVVTGSDAVANGQNFQAALNTAVPGDIIVLQAGASYKGPFTLPAKDAGNWITIQSSEVGSLPLGMRVGPSQAGAMPRVFVPGVNNGLSGSVVATVAGAQGYRFIGIEITTDKAVRSLVSLGSGTETSISALPKRFSFDRCYFHGSAGFGSRAGIRLNAVDVTVVNCYFSNLKSWLGESQALLGWNSPGPFWIENNYLEAATENIMFGGADPTIPGLVPADITILRNHFYKPLSWRGTNLVIKNLFELKNARRVRAEGNVFENIWLADQKGFAIQFTPSPGSVVEDVTFVNNIVRHASAGINMLGRDDLQVSEQLKRMLIRNNLFVDVSHVNWGGRMPPEQSGRLFQLSNGTQDVTIDHNTAFQTRAVVFAGGAAHQGYVHTNNISPHNSCATSNNCGISGVGTNPGIPTLNLYFFSAVPERNVMFQGNENGMWSYYGINYFPPSVDFNPDYSLAVTPGNNPYFRACWHADRTFHNPPRTLGADLAAVYAATSGVVQVFTTP